ncbi:MAG: glycosyltransferase, partial [Cyclobacteriaceae bacterium]
IVLDDCPARIGSCLIFVALNLQVDIVAFILLGFLGIQLIYLTVYLLAFSNPKIPHHEVSASISVIVCAHDEEQNLRELIPLLTKQEYDEYEIIVVEDRSNDGSFDYLYETASQNKNVKLVPVKSKPDHVNGKKFALTLGVKAAKYEWILLTDADCRPNSNRWIKEMSFQFSKDTSVVLGYSPYLKTSGLLNAFIRFESLLTGIQYMGMALLGKPYMGVGRNLAYRKNVFLENKGFKSHLTVTGGDDDLLVNEVSEKNNTAVSIGAEAIVFSKPKTTWGDFYVQKLRHLSVGKYYKTWDKLRLGLFNTTWVGSWALIVPALLHSQFFYLLLGVMIARTVLLTILAHTASRKLGDRFEAWKVPFLDFIFVIYYLVTGLVALHTNNIRWKKT